jgi:hypothetical protein
VLIITRREKVIADRVDDAADDPAGLAP